MAIALSLPTLALSRDEADLIDYHVDRLAKFERANKLAAAYYEGRQRVKHLGIAIPPSLRDIDTIVGWPGTVVDVIEERLDWLGWTSDTGDVLGLDDIARANDLDVEAGLGHLDALIYGLGFVIVGAGFEGEPQPLITVESPRNVTGEWDGRIRRLSSALQIEEVNDGHADLVSLYLPDQTIRAVRAGYGWTVADRDEHGLGRVPVAVLPNKPRASRAEGRSEITPAVRSYTDAAVRTLLGMEVHREFYQAPQRYALGADESAFTDADGNVKTGWETVMGRMLAIPRDEDGEMPQVGQFTPSSPQPYLEQVRGLAQLMAGEAGIPSSYMGFVSDNPASADAIRAAEARLVKRAERRQTVFGRGWREVAYLALLTRDGAVPAEFANVGNRWRDAATPTRSAAADEATKLIGTGVLTPDSSVTYDRVGLTPQEQRTLESDKRRARAQTRIEALGAAADAARSGNADVIDLEARRGSGE